MSDRIRIAVLVPVTLEGIGDQAMYDLFLSLPQAETKKLVMKPWKQARWSWSRAAVAA